MARNWYIAYPSKDHPNGRCDFCLALFCEVDYNFWRPPLEAKHVMRRVGRDEAIVYELEGRKPDYYIGDKEHGHG